MPRDHQPHAAPGRRALLRGAVTTGAAAAMAVAAPAALTACGMGSGSAPGPPAAAPPPPPTTVPPPTTAPSIDPDRVDTTDPDAVADAVALTIAVRDATTDTSPLDSQARASRWYAPTLGTIAPGTEVSRPDDHWHTLRAHRAHDVVDALDRTADDAPVDATTAYRTRTVTTHAENAGGWRGESRTTRFWLTLVLDGRDWRVSSLRSQ